MPPPSFLYYKAAENAAQGAREHTFSVILNDGSNRSQRFLYFLRVQLRKTTWIVHRFDTLQAGSPPFALTFSYVNAMIKAVNLIVRSQFHDLSRLRRPCTG